tara:strand:+ start:3983 stop:4138 length:156 start_codon:yes stop_codon:yes gene_type:complete
MILIYAPWYSEERVHTFVREKVGKTSVSGPQSSLEEPREVDTALRRFHNKQ